MILKGSQRGNAAQLARHLLNLKENEHVELHELRGFASEGLLDALSEAEAVAKGTRCKQCLFSLALSPPPGVAVDIATFETAIEMVEMRLGLEGLPRAIVFHEKEGRRHAHAVWSRIDHETMTARPLPFFKTRLNDVEKELFLHHQWEMPKGFIDHALRNPLNFSREGFCCTNPVMDSSGESSVIAGVDEPAEHTELQDPELARVQRCAQAARVAVDLVRS